LLALSSVSSLLRLRPVQDISSLRRFLQSYHREILIPLELVAIRAAHGHVARHEVRELVELDRQLASQAVLRNFASASQRVGQTQLQKLRPLRDQRVVQRYLHAVENGEAYAWHTLVYGLTLAVYSLPLRQGLIGYAHQTTRGFIYSAARSLRLSERKCRNLFDELCDGLPEAVDAMVGQPALV
jgi:urease accessory protein UreF